MTRDLSARPGPADTPKVTVLRALLPVSLAALLTTSLAPALDLPVQALPALALSVQSPASLATDLRTRLHAAIAGSSAASVSVAVDVDGLGAVYRAGADVALPPASTEKLFPTFAALQALGPTARLRTELRTSAAQRGPYLSGDLYLVAGGDPYLTTSQLDALAANIRAAGIRKVVGSLVVDDLRYDAVRRAPGWRTSYVPDESGPLSALALDRNAWRRDAAYLNDPALPTLDRLRTMLARHGVAVSPTMRRGRPPADARLIASHVSATMIDLVKRVSKNSDNFGAELLLKEVGRVVRGTGSTAGGASAVRQVLGQLGVSTGTLVDGSGLSSQDRQTATGELSLLRAAEQSRSYAALRRSLPIACVDGTLKERMCGSAAAGRAVAKTGTLPGTYALTGWTTTADGHLVRYAILLSRATSGTKARAAIDECVALLSAARTS